MIPKIITTTKWVAYINGYPVSFATQHEDFPKFRELVEAEDIPGILDLIYAIKGSKLNIPILQAADNYGDIEFKQYATGELECTFRGELVPQKVTEVLYGIFNTGSKDLSFFYKFLERCFCATESVREELYSFLASAKLTIQQDGKFIAYKGVRKDMYSETANVSTRVLRGETRNGAILNAVGSTIEVHRDDVCDNRDEGCSTGLHVGSYSYAKDFGKVVLACEVDPADVVSVPLDCSCSKCRVSKYKVLSIVSNEIDAVEVEVTAEDNSAAHSLAPIVTPAASEASCAGAPSDMFSDQEAVNDFAKRLANAMEGHKERTARELSKTGAKWAIGKTKYKMTPALIVQAAILLEYTVTDAEYTGNILIGNPTYG